MQPQHYNKDGNKMTKQELNRDVKRLFNRYKANSGGEATDQYFDWLEKEVKPELRRLYDADNTFNSLTADNIKRIIRLNLLLRVIPFHQFGLYINL